LSFLPAAILPCFLFGFKWDDLNSRFRDESRWFVFFVFLLVFWSALTGYLAFLPKGDMAVYLVLSLSLLSGGITIIAGLVSRSVFQWLQRKFGYQDDQIEKL
jgi:hypothetical protein